MFLPTGLIDHMLTPREVLLQANNSQLNEVSTAVSSKMETMNTLHFSQ